MHLLLQLPEPKSLMFSLRDSNSLVVDDFALAFKVIQAVCIGISAGEGQEP